MKMDVFCRFLRFSRKPLTSRVNYLRTSAFEQPSRFLSAGVTERSCRLLIIGGGTGGCTIASKMAPRLGADSIIVVEPSPVHYYQPMFTLVGAGLKTLEDSKQNTKDVLPKTVEWLQDSVETLEAHNNYVVTNGGVKINYDYMVIAIGLHLDYAKIPGLVDGLAITGSGICSNYSPNFVERTRKALDYYEEGNLIFTFPNTPIKCAGAPQKACYLSEDLLRQMKKNGKGRVIYNTSLPVLFSVKKYADALWKVCKSRGIDVNVSTELVAVEPDRKVAIFRKLGGDGNSTFEMPYSVLHVTPPMSPPQCIAKTPKLGDASGYLDVHKHTLQHKNFSNIFGIGDCTNLPTSKTAAAVAAQSGVLYDNLLLAMSDNKPLSSYNGYSSCPLVTSCKTCILAEFDYDLQPLETFPFDQATESRLMFHLKKDIMPSLYWQFMLRGYWSGPETIRKMLHFSYTGKKPVDVPQTN